MTAVLGLAPLAWVSIGLLVAGVIGSAVPGIPGALLSIAGVLTFWWQSGYADPPLLVLVGLVLVGVLALAVDLFAGMVGARAGGASTTTTLVAGVVGFALFFVAGPVGVLAGVGGTVFALELRASADVAASTRAAVYTSAAVLASTVVQVLLTLAILFAMVLVVVI